MVLQIISDGLFVPRGVRSTQRLCTLVSIAMRFGLIELGLPGRPYGTEKLIELDCEN